MGLLGRWPAWAKVLEHDRAWAVEHGGCFGVARASVLRGVMGMEILHGMEVMGQVLRIFMHTMFLPKVEPGRGVR